MVGVLGPLLGSHACRGSRAVVAVSHVEGIHAGGEDLGDAGHVGVVVYHPELVGEVVLVNEAALGRPGDGLLHYAREFRVVLVGEEDGLYVGVLDADVHHPVVLLLLEGELVLLDYAACVVVGVSAEHKAVLGPAAHCLGVDVIALLGILHQPAALLP